MKEKYLALEGFMFFIYMGSCSLILHKSQGNRGKEQPFLANLYHFHRLHKQLDIRLCQERCTFVHMHLNTHLKPVLVVLLSCTLKITTARLMFELRFFKRILTAFHKKEQLFLITLTFF